MTTSTGSRRPATSADVAVRAGVSRSTVSDILNGNHDRYPESTRQRVRDAAVELDYRPSLAGRSLVSGRSDTVVVLLPNTTFGSNLQDAVDQVMVGMSPMGGNVVVRFAGTTPEATLSAVLALRPLGVVDLGVLSPTDRDDLEAQGILTVPRAPTGGAERATGVSRRSRRMLSSSVVVAGCGSQRSRISARTPTAPSGSPRCATSAPSSGCRRRGGSRCRWGSPAPSTRSPRWWPLRSRSGSRATTTTSHWPCWQRPANSASLCRTTSRWSRRPHTHWSTVVAPAHDRRRRPAWSGGRTGRRPAPAPPRRGPGAGRRLGPALHARAWRDHLNRVAPVPI